jgi:hypothetical protein
VNIKSGFKTSEAIGGAALVAGILAWIKGAPTSVQIAGICAVGVLGAAYMVSRAIAKKQ